MRSKQRTVAIEREIKHLLFDRADTDEDSAVREAIRRDEEFSSGSATGRTHEEVMQAARLRPQ